MDSTRVLLLHQNYVYTNKAQPVYMAPKPALTLLGSNPSFTTPSMSLSSLSGITEGLKGENNVMDVFFFSDGCSRHY